MKHCNWRAFGSRAAGCPEQDGRQRLASQSSQEWKVQQADRVIVNTGSMADLERQVDELWQSVVEAESS